MHFETAMLLSQLEVVYEKEIIFCCISRMVSKVQRIADREIWNVSGNGKKKEGGGGGVRRSV